MSILVAHASKHGSTEETARFIADRLRERGIEADAAPVQDVSHLSGVEAVVLGSAIYLGSWMKEALDFVDRHLSTLQSIPVWLFSVGPLGTEIQDEEEQPKQLGESQTAETDARCLKEAPAIQQASCVNLAAR